MGLLGQLNGPPELSNGGTRFLRVSGYMSGTSVDFQKAMTLPCGWKQNSARCPDRVPTLGKTGT